jgi:lipopolysaccharide transport system ATP-binding protein
LPLPALRALIVYLHPMGDTAIKVEGVSKVYKIGRERNISIAQGMATAFKRLTHPNHESEIRSFHALKDVSFELKQGDKLGILGRNGAGKSTMLKVLSRITYPTRGKLSITGRIASLLEVGTGFHPDLTGRENIYLNGSMLGMTRREIRSKFDQIVDFSGVEKFIDTPVKRFSSGMYVRLAFSVAAHLEPEIMIVDEVLAVGDLDFQKKCLKKMNDIARTEGRTIIFVSHDSSAVSNLCSKGLVLQSGEVIYSGDVQDALDIYIESLANQDIESTWSNPTAMRDGEAVHLLAARIVCDDKITNAISINRDFALEIDFEVLEEGVMLNSGIQITDHLRKIILSSANWASATATPDEWSDRPYAKGRYRSVMQVPANFLNDGIFYVNLRMLRDFVNTEVEVNEAIRFTVVDNGEMRKEFTGNWPGVVRPRLAWHTEQMSLVTA